MNNNEPLSQKEFAYIRQQEKSEAYIATLEAKIANKEAENAELLKKVETLTVENEQLKKDLLETTTECQLHVDNVECQMDDLEKQIEEHKTQVPLKAEIEKEVKIIYHKQAFMGRLFRREDKSNWIQQEVLSSDTERIQSLVNDGYEKKETELPIQFKK